MSENDEYKTNRETETLDRHGEHGMTGVVVNNRFQIRAPLLDKGADRGGIGDVFLASDLRLLGKDVVVKLLNKDALESEYVSRKFQHEQEALIRLDHPNIVRILDAGLLPNGEPYIVMEHIPGSSLRKLLDSEGKIPLSLAALVIESIGAALGAAHSHGILHRDIKPENIMITPEGAGEYRVRLIDFGIARVADSVTGPHTEVARTVGTLRYMAPEQLQGTIEHTVAVDVYALGVVAYEMLAGDHPFTPQSTVDMFEQQKAGVQVPPRAHRREVSEAADRMVLSALAFAPEERPQDARRFGRALAEALKETSAQGFAEPQAPAVTVASAPVHGEAVGLSNAAVQRDSEAMVDSSAPESHGRRGGAKRWLVGAAAAVVLLLLVSLPLGYFAFKSLSPGREESAGAEGSAPAGEGDVVAGDPDAGTVDGPRPAPADSADDLFEYDVVIFEPGTGELITVPREAAGNPGAPAVISHEFRTGQRFRFRFRPMADGYIYAFNEERGDKAVKTYNLLYPAERLRRSAKVAAGGVYESANNEFRNGPADEIVWIVFSKSHDEVLEAARIVAFNEDAPISGGEEATALSLMFADYVEGDSKPRINVAAKTVTVRSGEQRVIYRLELRHR